MSKKTLHLLIDGADKLGKSTVCQMLSRYYNIPIIKMPNMKEYIKKGSPEEFSKLFNETVIQFAEYDFILDRGFTSSLVYSKVFKRDFDLSYIDKIEQILKPEVHILIGQRFSIDDVYNVNEVNLIDKKFYDLAVMKGYHKIIVDNKSPIEICQEIISSVQE